MSPYVWMIYLLVVLYALCYQLQSPLEPFLVERLVGSEGEAASSYARLQSLFSAVQTLGSLCFGLLLDKFGVRVGFIVNFLCCALTYYLLSICDSIEILYLSKLPGLGMAGFLCAQMAVTNLTEEGNERIVALGRLTTSYTIGGILGPYLGGQLGASGNYTIGASYATIGSVCAAILVCCLPGKINNTIEKYGKQQQKATQKAKDSWFAAVSKLLYLVGLLLFAKVVTSVANSMSASAQPLILKNSLGFDEASMGSFMSVKFASGGVTNGFLLGYIARLMGGHMRVVVRNCIAAMAVGYLVQAACYSEVLGNAVFGAGNLPTSGVIFAAPFLGLSFLMSMFQFSLATSITAESTSIVPSEYKGTLLGLEHSLFAVARVFGPAAGISVLQAAGISGLSLACFSIFAAVYAIWVSFSPPVWKKKKT